MDIGENLGQKGRTPVFCAARLRSGFRPVREELVNVPSVPHFLLMPSTWAGSPHISAQPTSMSRKSTETWGTRQTCARQHGNVGPRENGHTVPGALPLPDCLVPESSKGIHGKGLLLCLELLEAHHVRLSFS